MSEPREPVPMPPVPDINLPALRTLVQAFVATVVASLLIWVKDRMGVDLGQYEGWLNAVIWVGMLYAWTAGVRWLESRTDSGTWSMVARWLGRALMLGAGARRQPVYLAPGQSGAREPVTGAVLKSPEPAERP